MADRTSQPMAATSTGTWPTDWQASRTKKTSWAAHRAPTASAGLTRPPLVGTWVRATIAAPSPELGIEVVEADLAVLVVVDEHDLDAEPVPQLQEGDDVAGVLGSGGEHPVTGRNGKP